MVEFDKAILIFFRIQNLPQQPFPPNGPFSQTNIQGNPGQQPHYVTSSTHMMH